MTCGLSGEFSLVLQLDLMERLLTMALRRVLAWLAEGLHRICLRVDRIAGLQSALQGRKTESQRFMRHAGIISGPKELSARGGFTRR
jgi:hypothetical protein